MSKFSIKRCLFANTRSSITQCLFSAVLTLGYLSTASAASTFVEDFSSNTLGLNLSQIEGTPSNVVTSSGNVYLPNSSQDRYDGVGTLDDDYHTVDFIFPLHP